MTSLQFLGAVAIRPAVLPAIADFEAQTGVVVACRWDLNPAIDVQIRAGASFDLVVTNPHFIEQLSVIGKVLANTQVPFGRIGLGVAARADADRPRIDTQETFEAALQNATSIAYASEGSSGAHFVDLLERLGLTRDVGPKLIPVAGAGTASSVARGEAELAVVPVTSILAAGPEVMLAGRFPQHLGGYIDFDIALNAATGNRESATHLANFLMSPDRDEALLRIGVDRRS